MELLSVSRKTLMAEGIIITIIGILAIILPTATTLSIVILLGILSIIAGIVQLIRIVQYAKHAYFWAGLVSSVLAIIVGLLLLLYPLHGAMVLALLLGIWFLLHGIVEVGFSIHIRHYSKNWFMLCLSGIISIILALIIWSGWPLSSLWVVGLLVGINLIFFGMALYSLAFRLKSDQII